MIKTIKRKEFEKLFLPYNESTTQIWVITRVKQLPEIIVNMAINMAELDFIKYIRLCDESLMASNENYPNRPKVPIVHGGYENAIGIEVLYSTNHQTIDFYDINSPIKGNGSKMVDAILKDLPLDWKPSVLNSWSDGFWNKMEEKYKQFDWIR